MDMTGYIPKHAVNPHGDGIHIFGSEIFQLEPDASSGGQSERIYPVCLAGRIDIFLILPTPLRAAANKRIKDFLSVDGGDL